eukprot:TRINITY_DN33735_c0_g1_i1.p1 TRINITY_DN33735_c0_g1~~TRINITY_DN33735_c0_g1_i1.p1  ORF type:complete len:305 (+),score=57.18 TRINITY_DN33735_c0_g1_i1:33-947(+)
MVESITNEELHAHIEKVVKEGCTDTTIFDRGCAGDDALWDGRMACYEHRHTPLTHCIRGMWRSGNEVLSLEVIKMLASKGASLMKPCTSLQTERHLTPLNLASNLHLPDVQEWLENELKRRSENEGTPISDLLPSVANEWFRKLHSILTTDRSSELLDAPAKITNHIYLGNLKQAKASPKKYKCITAILNCLGDTTKAHHTHHRQRYHGFEAEDIDEYPLLHMHLEEAAEFISSVEKEKSVVLVHCYAGVNRSAAICVAYLVKYHRWPLTKALIHVHTQRPIILSNQSFRDQLIRLAYEEGLLE